MLDGEAYFVAVAEKTGIWKNSPNYKSCMINSLLFSCDVRF